MKTQTLGLLAILSLGVGLTSFSSASIFQESTDFGTYGEGAAISGHVTLIQRDAQDNILSYQQYDNIITNEGLNCITEIVFATTNATCAAVSTTDQFDKIGLLGSTPTAVAESTAVSLTEITGTGLDPVTAGDVIGVDIAGDGVTTVQGKSVSVLVHTFTKTGAGGVVVGGAVLSNDAGDALLAAKAFTGGDLTLNENDTLEVKWSIQIGS